MTDAAPVPATGRRRGMALVASVVHALALPSVVFALIRWYLLGVGVKYGGGVMWARWDAGLYLSIAGKGYELLPCNLVNASWPATMPCGNAGWLPGYPLLIRLFTPLFQGIEEAASAVSAVCAWACLVVAWTLWQKKRYSLQSLLVLALMVTFPGSIYYHADFPISLCALAALLSLYFAARHQRVAAGLAGAAAAFSYSTGMLMIPVLGLWGIAPVLRLRQGLRAALKACIAPALTLAGYGVFFVILKLSVGRWDAFFIMQAKYGHGVNNPFAILWERLAPFLKLGLRAKASDIQTAYVCLVMICCQLALVVKRRSATSLDWLLWVYCLWYWLFPLMMGKNLSLYRSEALLLPLVFIMRLLPLWLQGVLLVPAVVIADRMAVLFFTNALI